MGTCSTDEGYKRIKMKLDELRDLLVTTDNILGYRTIDNFVEELTLNLLESSDSDLFPYQFELKDDDFTVPAERVSVDYDREVYELVGDIALVVSLTMFGTCRSEEDMGGQINYFDDIEVDVKKLEIDVCGALFNLTWSDKVVSMFKEKITW